MRPRDENGYCPHGQVDGIACFQCISNWIDGTPGKKALTYDEQRIAEGVLPRTWTIRIYPVCGGWKVEGTDQHGRDLWDKGNYPKTQRTREKAERYAQKMIAETRATEEATQRDRIERASAATYEIQA